MRVRDLFPKDHLCAEDLHGKDVTLTISRVTMEDLHNIETNKKERKPVVWFQEMEQRHAKDSTLINKRLVLNSTNAHAIAQFYGEETDEWSGQKVTLCPTETRLGRETVPCIRVLNDKGQVYDVRKGKWIARRK